MTNASELAIDRNVKVTIVKMLAKGTTGASIECLLQNAPTTGVHVPVGMYRSLFEAIATKVARKFKFQIIQGDDQ